MTHHRMVASAFGFVCFLAAMVGCQAQNATPVNTPSHLSPPVVIQQQSLLAVFHESLSEKITSANTESLAGPGLVGAVGGVNVKLLQVGEHEVLMPLPQLVDGQIPLCYFVRSIPAEAVTEYRIQKREELNDVLTIKLTGKRDDQIQLEWSAVVMLTGQNADNHELLPDAYLSPTSCVQADSGKIRELAAQLWPASGAVDDYAHNIQRFIMEMKRVKQPRSMDALGILDSGVNGICTANANLALSLMRAKAIACRSMAVIPPTSQRLEMHRIVEYRDGDQKKYFDPSSLHATVPMQPWQTLVMTRTTISDEQLAMKPRMGTSLGCPYAQEIELPERGVTFWGKEFFWTMAKPLAPVEFDNEAIARAKEDWKRFIREGTVSEQQSNTLERL